MNDRTIIFLAFVIIIILIVIVYNLLKRIVNEINTQAKSIYLHNISNYETLNIKDTSSNIAQVSKEFYPDINPNQKDIIVSKDIAYKQDRILSQAKKIEEEFDISNIDIIEDFLKNKVQENSENLYQNLLFVKETLSYTSNPSLVKEISVNDLLKDMPEDVGNILRKKYSNQAKVRLMNVLEILDLEIKKNDPTIYIMVGDKDLSCDMVDNRIKTIYNKDILFYYSVLFHRILFNHQNVASRFLLSSEKKKKERYIQR